MERDRVKVRVLPAQPHCFAFGGFDIQMLAALEAARGAGVDARALDAWSRDADFDVLHVWGLEAAHTLAVTWARRAGKRIVMTALLPYLTLARRLRQWGSYVIGPARWRRQLLACVDVLVVVNDLQREAAAQLYGLPMEQIAVVPNIVGEPFFQPASAPLREDSSPPYVLCTGNICERKNQLRLAQAAVAAGCSLRLIGNALTGEEVYAAALSEYVARHATIRWIKGLQAGSPELVRVYRAAAAFALPSIDETQPISLLEAAAAGIPLLTSERPFARQKYYRNARLVDPLSVDSIRDGLQQVIAQPRDHVAPAGLLGECRQEVVGRAYRAAYQLAMSRR